MTKDVFITRDLTPAERRAKDLATMLRQFGKSQKVKIEPITKKLPTSREK
jgi:hypothetical protein